MSDKKIGWVLRKQNLDIDPQEYLRRTDQSVWTPFKNVHGEEGRPKRRFIKNDYSEWFFDLESAKQRAKQIAEKRVEAARRRLDSELELREAVYRKYNKAMDND